MGLKPVEIVGYEVDEAGITLALDNGWFTSLPIISVTICAGTLDMMSDGGLCDRV